jgi:HEAT repeat protein
VAAGPVKGYRREAIAALGDWGTPEALPVLLKMLGASDDSDIVDALGRIGDPKTAPTVVNTLKTSPYFFFKVPGYDAIARLGAKEGVPLLLDHLSQNRLPYRGEAMRALGCASPGDAGTLCDKWLDSPKAELPIVAADEAARLGLREKIPAIARLLGNPNGELRAAAMRALVRLEARDQAGAIAARLSTPEDLETAARALASLGARDKVDSALLLPGLKAANPWARYQAIETLEKLEAKDRLDDILPFLKSPEYFLRYKAAVAVGVLAGKKSLEPLRPLLQDSNCMVRYYAAGALCSAGLEEGAVTLLKETRDRRNPHQFGELTVSDTRTCRILNSLRQPDGWKKLSATRLPALPPGTRREHLERLAQEAGLKVEWAEGRADAWLDGRASIELFEPPITLLDGLVHLLQGSRILGAPPRFELVLEADRLRVLPYLDAIRFWEAWQRTRR